MIIIDIKNIYTQKSVMENLILYEIHNDKKCSNNNHLNNNHCHDNNNVIANNYILEAIESEEMLKELTE